MVAQGENICNLPSEIGPVRCLGYFPRYHFDKVAGECKKFIYGGCRGTANNFDTLAACQKTCEDPQACLLPKIIGPCKGKFPRFYFDKRAGKCKKFFYGGCGGNANNFETKRACRKRCVRN